MAVQGAFLIKIDLLNNIWTELYKYNSQQEPQTRTNVYLLSGSLVWDSQHFVKKKPALKNKEKSNFFRQTSPKLVKISHFLGQRWNHQSPYHLFML